MKKPSSKPPHVAVALVRISNADASTASTRSSWEGRLVTERPKRRWLALPNVMRTFMPLLRTISGRSYSTTTGAPAARSGLSSSARTSSRRHPGSNAMSLFSSQTNGTPSANACSMATLQAAP